MSLICKTQIPQRIATQTTAVRRWCQRMHQSRDSIVVFQVYWRSAIQKQNCNSSVILFPWCRIVKRTCRPHECCHSHFVLHIRIAFCWQEILHFWNNTSHSWLYQRSVPKIGVMRGSISRVCNTTTQFNAGERAERLAGIRRQHPASIVYFWIKFAIILCAQSVYTTANSCHSACSS